MADLNAVYANKHVVMVVDAVRMILIDSRQNVGRVAITETVVCEVVMTEQNAREFAQGILDAVNITAEFKEREHGR